MTPVFRFLSPISLPRKHFVHLGSSFFLSSLLFLPLICPDPYEDMDLLLYSTAYRFLQFLLLDDKNVFVPNQIVVSASSSPSCVARKASILTRIRLYLVLGSIARSPSRLVSRGTPNFGFAPLHSSSASIPFTR
jgi:hypothetical protein